MTVFKKGKTREFTVVERNLETRVGRIILREFFCSSLINANIIIPIVVEKKTGLV